jgi:hypothetical protein
MYMPEQRLSWQIDPMMQLSSAWYMITTSASIIKFSVYSAQEQLTHRGWTSGTLHGGLSLALHVLHQDTDLNKRDVGIHHGLCGRQFARREQRAGMQARVDRMPLSAVSLIQTCYCIDWSNMTGVDLAKSGPIGVPASAVITNCTHNLDYSSGSQLMNCVYGVAVHVFGIAWVANVEVSVTSWSNPS